MGLTLAVFGWQPLRSSQPDLVLGVQLMTLEHYSGHLFSEHRQGPLGAWPTTLADQAPPHSRWHFQPLRSAWALVWFPVWEAYMWVVPGRKLTWPDGSNLPQQQPCPESPLTSKSPSVLTEASGSFPCHLRLEEGSREQTQAFSGWDWQSVGEGTCKGVCAQNPTWECDRSPPSSSAFS